MTFPVAAFAEATAYERYILDELAPAIPQPSGKHILDLREDKLRQHAQVTLGTITARAYVGGVPAQTDLTPLVFGAAWKVIDVLIETQLVVAEGPGPHNISKKVKKAKHGNGVRREHPFPADIWQRILRTYANTYDLRHSLTHRGIKTHSDGSLEATPEPGQTRNPTKMARDELKYFFRAVQETHTSLIRQSLGGREAGNLRFLLNRLQALHGLGPTTEREIKGDVVVQVYGEADATGRVTFDLARVTSETSVRHPNAGCQLEIHLDDGRIISGPFEDWPAGQSHVNPDKPPAAFTVIE
ncbi:hypothetical protein E1286_44810 [Nonomuraea terrae]|uniref:Uncharacterized protein n=1 Tax=Nonomuraea terrae TaxID=2530383 RepID=A0A4R4XKU2_9ACTN|nr:hypothetical protein [Nonomuraea terrae]TDD31525.1 hypothetical protein E1286_44810 [Nonomuraea terrae]